MEASHTEIQTKSNNQSHDDPTSGHFGALQTSLKIFDMYYWPKMQADILRFKNYIFPSSEKPTISNKLNKPFTLYDSCITCSISE